MADRVVLCEGPRDVRFLKQVYDRKERRLIYDDFNNERSDISETERLRQHAIDEQTEVLFKSEGGISKLINIFVSVSVQAYTESGFELYVLADLDDRPVCDLIQNFNDKLLELCGNKVKLQSRTWSTNECMRYMICDLLINGSSSGKVEFMLFYSSLESETGITDRDNVPAQIRKIDRYLDEHPGIDDGIIDTIHS
jgi:hypothetical protein